MPRDPVLQSVMQCSAFIFVRYTLLFFVRQAELKHSRCQDHMGTKTRTPPNVSSAIQLRVRIQWKHSGA